MNISPLTMPLLDDRDRREAFFLALPEIFIDEWFYEIESTGRFSAKRLNVLDQYIQLLSRPSFVFLEEQLKEQFNSFESNFSLLREFLENNFVTTSGIAKFIEHDDELLNSESSTLTNLMTDTAIEYQLLVSVLTGRQKKSSVDSLHYSKYENKFVWGGTNFYTVSGKKKQQMFKILWPTRCKKNKLTKVLRVSHNELVSKLGLTKNQDALIKIVKDSRAYLKRKGVPVEINGNTKKGFVLVELN